MIGRRLLRAGKTARLLLLGLLVPALGARVSESRRPQGLPEDWTHHHIIFTTDVLRRHPELAARDPRVVHQLYRRLRPGWFGAIAGVANLPIRTALSTPQRDWNLQTGGKVPFAMFPVKYNTDPSAPPSCSNDFVEFALNSLGSATQATVLAVTNIYSGPGGVGGFCTGSPTILFAYNTSTLAQGRIRTSPLLSLDGKKLAFIESNTTTSVLHVLSWGNTGSNGTSFRAPAVPGVGNNASLVSVTYANTSNNHSSPWLDYASDTMYVGADDGRIYQITGIFKSATPTVVTTGGWPVTVNANVQLSGPVLDPVTNRIFLGDNRGFLNSFSVSAPGLISKLAVGTTGRLNPSVIDAPFVDSTNGTVFATSSNDGTSAVLVEASTTTLAQITRIRLGVGSTTGTGVNLYDGTFDNNYYNNPASGYMLACATGSTDTSPWRYHFTFSGTTILPDPAPVQISTSTTARCGSVSEFFNPNINSGTDFFFWGVTNTCPGMTTGCVMALDSTGTLNTAAEAGGVSGIIVDNDSTLPQTSNIYFTTEGAPLNAIKLSQNGLQ